MPLTPLIAIHLSFALSATAIGPVALWARRSGKERTRLHRAAGYAFVTLLLGTAISAIFIRGYSLPNWRGITPLHLLIPITLLALGRAFWHLRQGCIAGHKRVMRILYFSACVVAGLFTLMPGRLIGNWLWA